MDKRTYILLSIGLVLVILTSGCITAAGRPAVFCQGNGYDGAGADLEMFGVLFGKLYCYKYSDGDRIQKAELVFDGQKYYLVESGVNGE